MPDTVYVLTVTRPPGSEWLPEFEVAGVFPSAAEAASITPVPDLADWEEYDDSPVIAAASERHPSVKEFTIEPFTIGVSDIGWT